MNAKEMIHKERQSEDIKRSIKIYGIRRMLGLMIEKNRLRYRASG